MSSLTIPGPTALFHAVEMQIDLPASGVVVAAQAHGSRPRGARTQLTVVPASTETLRYSDHGYVSEAHVPYPPLVAEAFAIDRRLDLPPGDASSAETFGSITLNNPGGTLSNLVNSRVNDHLPVTILGGRKRIDPVRSILLDPVYADLVPMFTGLARSWQPDLNTVDIGLLDVSYWLAGSMQTATYGGTGGVDGDSNVSGRAKPRLRGYGCNITPVLIDTVNLVYQISDAPVTVSALYEGGYTGGIASSGIVSDIYASSSAPAPGHYTVQSSSTASYLRLGSKPVYTITLDALGIFPSGRTGSNLLDLLYEMLLEDCGLPQAYIDGSTFSLVSQACPWAAGWYWDGSNSVTGQDMVEAVLAGVGIRLIPTRAGQLRPVVLKAPAANVVPVAMLTPDNMTAVSAVALDSILDPPAYRWRVGYQHAFTVQPAGSGLHPQAPAARQSLIAVADRTATWASLPIKTRYRVPNDPALLVTALQLQADAATVAGNHGALWSDLRRIWAVTLPKAIAYGIDLGDPVSVTWPVPGLATGSIGLCIGEQVRSSDPTSILQILV